MYNQEKINPYGEKGQKGKIVEHMFDNIARHYDFLNHYLSFSIDKHWRLYAVKRLKEYNPKTILDIATGTGDFAILAAKKIQPESITAADISEGMMNVGRKKVEQCQLGDVIEFKREDCENLSFHDNTFDAVMSAFGIRNFQELDKALLEMHRVLKDGGHLCIAELTRPRCFPIKQLFWLYSHLLLPVIGKIFSHDKEAYEYLTATIEAFPQGERMMEILAKAGFRETSFKRLTFGICTVYMATK